MINQLNYYTTTKRYNNYISKNNTQKFKNQVTSDIKYNSYPQSNFSSQNLSYLGHNLSFTGLPPEEILKLKQAQEIAKKQRKNLPCIFQAIFPMDPEKATPKLIDKSVGCNFLHLL